MIKTIIFDVDGVLIDSFEANLKFNQDLMVLAGYNPPTRKIYQKMFHMSMEQAIRFLTKSSDEKEIKRIWLLGKNRKIWYHDELIATPDNYKTILRALSKIYTLAIVTSRIRDSVFSLPQLSDLQNLFKTTVYYEDTVKHKPEPDPLLLACERLAIKPSNAVYIGDTNADIKAAKAAGMKSIAYGKHKLLGADANTNSFEQIQTIVELINK
jgi:pyrophosphatase PpaX